MEPRSVVRAPWRRFRGLAGWVQIVVLLVAALVVVSPFTSKDDGQTVAATAPATTAEATVAPTTTVPDRDDETVVVRVIDGDTLEVTGGTRIRLIGVDTPETGDCFASDATRYANELVPAGTRVRFEYDVQRLDAYGRTLAYVYKVADGVFVNLAMARNGFAQQLTVLPNVAHAEEFRAAVASARTAGLGLWQGCRAPAPTTTAAPVASTAVPTTRSTVARPLTTTTAPAAGSGCHPSYTGACVPTGVSDVDCAGGGGNGPAYVSAKRFAVVGPDVYGLDSDHDGVACES
jgi:endonuclease YncB( thermonuclease family)